MLTHVKARCWSPSEIRLIRSLSLLSDREGGKRSRQRVYFWDPIRPALPLTSCVQGSALADSERQLSRQSPDTPASGRRFEAHRRERNESTSSVQVAAFRHRCGCVLPRHPLRPAGHRSPGSPSATTTIDGKAAPAAAAEFGGVIKETAAESKALVAAARRAAQGRAQRAAHHDRRPGLRRLRHLRRRHPDAGAGPHRQGGAALHAVPLHRAVLADAGGADHRPQPPLGRLRRDRRAVDRLPGLRLDHRPGERDHRRDPQGQRLRHVVVRQEPQHAGLSSTAWPGPSTNGRRDGLRVLLRLHGRRDRPVDAVPVPRSHPDLSVDRQARLQPHHRHGGRGDQAT